MNNIHTTEGMIEAHTTGRATVLARLAATAKTETSPARWPADFVSAQDRFDTVGLPRDAVLSAKVL